MCLRAIGVSVQQRVRNPFAVITLGIVLSACGSDSVGPPPPNPPQVTSITITPDSLALIPQETGLLSATVFDQFGNVMVGEPVVWTTGSPTVATVDAGGLVTGQSPGEVTIEATAGAVDGSSVTYVLAERMADNVTVIDSTRARLVSDSDQIATGQFEFQITGSAPEITVGDVMVVEQGGGYLRRVTAISQSGSLLTIETTEAALDEAVDAGTFDISVPVSLGTTSSPAFSAAGISFGPPEFGKLPPGVSRNAAGLSLRTFDLCRSLFVGSCPSGTTFFVDGGIELDADADAELRIGLSGVYFKATLQADLAFQADVTLRTSGAIELKSEFGLDVVRQRFWGLVSGVPVYGVVVVRLYLGAEVSVDEKVEMEGGVSSDYSITLGAEYDGQFLPINEFRDVLEIRPARWLIRPDGAEVRLYVRAEAEVYFYNIPAPKLGLKPFIGLRGEAAPCAWKSTFFAGYGVTLDYSLEIFGRTLAGFEWDWEAPHSVLRETTTPTCGILEVHTFTTGPNQDPDGYTVTVSGENRAIGTNGTVTFTGLNSGTYSVGLSGIADNCSVTGANPRSVFVSSEGSASEVFEVVCPPPSGDLVVRTATTGELPDPDGYVVTLNGGQARSIGINGSTTFRGLTEGTYSIKLEGIAENCTTSGNNPRTIRVTTGGTASTTFSLSCPDTGTTITMDVDPRSLTFGNALVGKVLSLNPLFTNSSNSTEDLTVEVSIEGPGFSISEGSTPRFTLTPGGLDGIVVNFRPLSEGAYSGTLSISHNATNLENPFTVPLTGSGVLPGTISVPVVADAFVLEDAPFRNFGSDATVWVGQKTEARGLIRFDMSDVPSHAVVETAVLRLYVTTVLEAATGQVCEAGQDWDERGPSGVTWNTKPDWQGHCSAMNAPVGSGSWLEVNVTEAVRSWIDTPRNNSGFYLWASGESALQFTIASREWSDSRFVPQLHVQYR